MRYLDGSEKLEERPEASVFGKIEEKSVA